MNYSPIILFVYNRPIHTKKTVEALLKNKLASKSILYIYSDHPKKEENQEDVKTVRKYIHSIKGFKEVYIIERKQNYGLAKSIIEGVTEVISKHGKVIVLEDDLITSQKFLSFMNNMLEEYSEEEKIYSITGYNFPPKLMRIPEAYKYDIYFSPRAGSWGWATWKDRWEKADWEVNDYEEFLKSKQLQREFDKGGDGMTNMLINQMKGELDSWAIRWCYTLYKKDAYCIYPTRSYVDNIGMDGSGVHCGENDKYSQQVLNQKETIVCQRSVSLDEEMMSRFRNAYKGNKWRKILKKIKKNARDTDKKGKEKLKRLWEKSVLKVRYLFERLFLVDRVPIDFKWLGNKYGGFFVSSQFVDENSIVYSFGIGEDISFDRDLINLVGCKVHGFDPTPKSVKWVKNNPTKGFSFHPYGIGIKTGFDRLYLPRNRDYVSGSVLQTENTSNQYVKIELKSLENIMEELKHKKVDVLKMDIEGLEYEILNDIVHKHLHINQILVEFHDRFIENGLAKRHKIIRLLKESGYKLYAISKSHKEFSFLKEEFFS